MPRTVLLLLVLCVLVPGARAFLGALPLLPLASSVAGREPLQKTHPQCCKFKGAQAHCGLRATPSDWQQVHTVKYIYSFD